MPSTAQPPPPRRYRNSIKALPWFTSVRTILNDPAYAAWFIPFKKGGSFPNGTWHVPACDANYKPPLCSQLYQCVVCEWQRAAAIG